MNSGVCTSVLWAGPVFFPSVLSSQIGAGWISAGLCDFSLEVETDRDVRRTRLHLVCFKGITDNLISLATRTDGLMCKGKSHICVFALPSRTAK